MFREDPCALVRQRVAFMVPENGKCLDMCIV